jgi:predicted TIM-barrel fold metal-dependent hydrolase
VSEADALIIDAQIHVWEVDRADRPWPRPARNPPQRPDGFGARAAIAEMDAAGVDRAVLVPPTWVGESNATALEAAAAHPDRFRVMGRFDPLAPDRDLRLASWLSEPHMLGIRMTFGIEPFSSWLDDGTLDAFWAGCERNRIPVMAFVPNQARKLHRVAAKHPELTLILCHMGCDIEAKGAAAFRTLDDVIALAAFPRVAVKTSSAPSLSAEPFPYRDIEPFLRRIYDAFGARRMLWGTDFTRLTSSYPDCLRHFREGLDFLADDDTEWILGRTAQTLLDWP